MISISQGPARLKSFIPSILFSLQLIGLPLVSFLPGYLGMPSRNISVFFYLILSVFTALAFLIRGRYLVPNGIIQIFFLFFTIYIIRFVIEVILGSSVFSYTISLTEFSSYLFGLVIPAFCIHGLFGRDKTPAALMPILYVGLLLFSLATLKYYFIDGNPILDRLGANDILNPITTGHMGVTLLIISTFSVIGLGEEKKTIYKLMYLIGIPFGALLLIFSASKGPVIAALIILTLMMAIGVKRKRYLAVVSLCLILILAFIYFYIQAGEQGIDLARFLSTEGFSSSQESSMERINLLKEAIRNFIDNPFFGAGPVMKASPEFPYPHNIIVEAFMATGIFGGGLFLAGIICLCYVVIKKLYNFDPYSWVGLLFLQYLIGGIFSGNLYYNLPLWACIGLSANLLSSHSYSLREDWLKGREAIAARTGVFR